MLRLARSHVPEARFLNMDMRQLQFDDGCFDGICAFYSLFHVPREDHLPVLIRFNRLLRQGGVLLFSTGKDAWQGTEEFHGTRMFWSHPDRQVTRPWVLEAGFAVMMSEVLELGGEEHYWAMARKNT
jgi:ubiquinone/menaquinone biosynthesis C-methylase UbiE